jgi:hypothetical protein
MAGSEEMEAGDSIQRGSVVKEAKVMEDRTENG